MTGGDKAFLCSMARSARLIQTLGMMGEPTVTAAAILVAAGNAHLSNIFLVTARTERIPLILKLELMWRVTLAASCLTMKCRFASGRRMAGRAGAHLGKSRLHRMRVMATGACPCRPVFRMVREDVGMTLRAATSRSSFHVVRIVAIRTVTMRRRKPRAKYMHFFMTLSTIDRGRFAALMRLVAGNALSVPVGEDRGTRNRGQSGSVARLTPVTRVGGGRVLVRMAGRAAFHGILTLGRVESVHLLMTRCTRSRLGPILFMRSVARQAISRAMHLYSLQVTLLLVVTPKAIFGSEGISIGRLRSIPWMGERVTAQAISHDAAPELLLGEGARVPRVGLLFMAVGTPFWPHLPHLSFREIMARRARDVLLQHVHPVAQNLTSYLPLFGDIDPFAPFWGQMFVGRWGRSTLGRTPAEEKSENPECQPSQRPQR